MGPLFMGNLQRDPCSETPPGREGETEVPGTTRWETCRGPESRRHLLCAISAMLAGQGGLGGGVAAQLPSCPSGQVPPPAEPRRPSQLMLGFPH